MKILSYVRLARPKHWLKNVLVFLPILYAQNLFVPDLLLPTLFTFLAFCLLSSTVYVLNDIADCKQDAKHPIKKNRPIASGTISISQGLLFAFFLLLTALGIAFFAVGYWVFFFALAYLLLNLAYSFSLKHQPVIDCFCIAAGFILRIYAGGSAAGAPITYWLFLTMTAASLFMAFGKRRGEFLQLAGKEHTRKVLASYNLAFLNGMTFLSAGLAIVFYALWSMGASNHMLYTVPFVFFIVARYLLLLHKDTCHGDPVSMIFADKTLLTGIFSLGVFSLILLYWY